jgi:hypothetical protein
MEVSYLYIGGLAEKNAMLDLLTAIFFGLAGMLMVYLGWLWPPLILGLVLGHLAELRGGLETAVARVTTRFRDRSGHARVSTFVVKRLHGRLRREAAIYRALQRSLGSPPAPRLLGEDEVGPEVTYLYLEYVRPHRAWPWGDVAATGSVLRQMAELHAALPTRAFGEAFASCDCEGELLRSARNTLELFQATLLHDDLSPLCPLAGPSAVSSRPCPPSAVSCSRSGHSVPRCCTATCTPGTCSSAPAARASSPSYWTGAAPASARPWRT